MAVAAPGPGAGSFFKPPPGRLGQVAGRRRWRSAWIDTGKALSLSTIGGGLVRRQGKMGLAGTAGGLLWSTAMQERPSKSGRTTLIALLLLGAVAVGAVGYRWQQSRQRPEPKSMASDLPKPPEVDPDSPFEPTKPNTGPAPGTAPDGMVWIPGGEFSMGSEDPRSRVCGGNQPMDDARPIHRVYVSGFWMDKTEVTNAQFAAFVAATGHITEAERTPRAEDFPDAPPEKLVAGSIVFSPPPDAVALDNVLQWWRWQPGANWRHPLGPDSSIDGKDNFPVVHVSFDDSVAYAKWAGKRLPTEAEYEFAERGGLTGQPYSWGKELKPGGKLMANFFQGDFPHKNSAEDGYPGIAPVGQFPPNGYGLYDITGNCWEWCFDWYRPDYFEQCLAMKIVRNPRGPADSYDPQEPNQPKRVHRGGSFLCAEGYCARFQAGTRDKGEPSTSSNHLSFRCVKSPPGSE